MAERAFGGCALSKYFNSGCTKYAAFVKSVASFVEDPKSASVMPQIFFFDAFLWFESRHGAQDLSLPALALTDDDGLYFVQFAVPTSANLICSNVPSASRCCLAHSLCLPSCGPFLTSLFLASSPFADPSVLRGLQEFY